MNQALYRRYRPETFTEVIGQEHVTEPLMQALRTGRVSHAYLFSGPRGCGKTTCARILARCLNCEKGPTPEPCGECPSCQELGRGGGGSLDVVEIDAASHGGVDDTRDLREKAVFAPARDRYKIFVLDEAHMVSREGFNALLKIVEEPPPHVKFIFATTEPNKVLPTIRSRSHHYPFRLVPPGLMTDYMEQLARSEQVEVAPGVMPMVVRAGGGSVRDTESVLDQLIGGSVDGHVTYERASSLLGFTPDELIGQMVQALGRSDGATMFAVIESVVESGLEPHRFAEDLLERLRDLIVLAAAGPSARQALRGLPEDQVAALAEEAARFGLTRLTWAADAVSTGLAAMAGATSPRLHLELLAARALLAAQGSSQPGPERQTSMDDAARPARPPDPSSRRPVSASPEPGSAAPFGHGAPVARPGSPSTGHEAQERSRETPPRDSGWRSPGGSQQGGPGAQRDGGRRPPAVQPDGWTIPGVTTGATWAASGGSSGQPISPDARNGAAGSRGQADQRGRSGAQAGQPRQGPEGRAGEGSRQFVDWDEPDAPTGGERGTGRPGAGTRGSSQLDPGHRSAGLQDAERSGGQRSQGQGDPFGGVPPRSAQSRDAAAASRDNEPGPQPGRTRGAPPAGPPPGSAPARQGRRPQGEGTGAPSVTSQGEVQRGLDQSVAPASSASRPSSSALGEQPQEPPGPRDGRPGSGHEGPGAAGGDPTERWQQLLAEVRRLSVTAHGLLSHGASLARAEPGQLTLAFATPDLMQAFGRRFAALMEQAAATVFGGPVRVDAMVAERAERSSGPSADRGRTEPVRPSESGPSERGPSEPVPPSERGLSEPAPPGERGPTEQASASRPPDAAPAAGRAAVNSGVSQSGPGLFGPSGSSDPSGPSDPSGRSDPPGTPVPSHSANESGPPDALGAPDRPGLAVPARSADLPGAPAKAQPADSARSPAVGPSAAAPPPDDDLEDWNASRPREPDVDARTESSLAGSSANGKAAGRQRKADPAASGIEAGTSAGATRSGSDQKPQSRPGGPGPAGAPDQALGAGDGSDHGLDGGEDEELDHGGDAGVRGLTGVPLVIEMLGGEIVEDTDEE